MSLKPDRNPEVVWREEAGAAARVESGEASPDAPCATLVYLGSMHQLNYVGAQVWRMCDGSRTPGEMARQLSERLDVAEDLLLGDVERFVEEMNRAGWLKA